MATVVSLAREGRSAPSLACRTFVVKVVSRCNLNCSYCYMYNLADRTYRDQPAVMQADVRDALARRIREHTLQHRVPAVHVILHGGEPLLMGRARLRAWVEGVRAILGQDVAAVFSVQSNGTLIDAAWIELLAKLGVMVGISVDGPRKFHDDFRLDHAGRGSFDRVLAAVRLLRSSAQGREVFSTVLAVVNTDVPPRELFDFWQELDVPGFDLSLPHANHLHRPPAGAVSYGDWLVEFFDLWFFQNRADRHIRYFENIIRMLFGYPISTDNIGGRPVDVVVVETDGSVEPTDAFKCCEHGITKLGLNVLRDEFDALRHVPMVRTLQAGAPALCSTCQSCEVVGVCGGGYMPHRYSKEHGFDNPSVYCADLEQLVRHVRRRVVGAIPTELLPDLGVRSLAS